MPPILQLWLGAVCISFAPILVKAVESVAPTPLGFYRCFLASLFLIPIALRYPKPPRAVLRTPALIWLIAGLGLVFAADLFVWHRAVIYVGAGMGTILGNTQVFYLALIGIFVYGERPGWKFLLAILLGFGGITILVNPSSEAGGNYWLGVGYGLSTGVFYATFLTLLRKLEALPVQIHTTYRLAMVSLSSAFFLLLFSLVEGTLVIPPAMDLLWLTLLALVAQVLGWLLITRNLPKLSVSLVGLLLLTQPVGATLWGNLLFQETLTSLQWVGALLTLSAIYLGTIRNV